MPYRLLGLDAYTFRARIAPALLVILPFVLGLTAWLPLEAPLQTILLGFGGMIALTALAAQLGRDRGRKLQPELFRRWGGAPSDLMLSFRHSSLDQETIRRYHEQLRWALPGLRIPGTREEEDASPEVAMQVYATCTRFLMERTRMDPLVNEENANFGYRRNLFGLKPFGISTSILGFGLSLARTWQLGLATPSAPVPSVVYGVLSLLLLLVWVYWITESWVRAAGHAYSLRLLAACEN